MFNEQEQAMIERIPELVNGDPSILSWGRDMNETFMLEVGAQQYLLTGEYDCSASPKDTQTAAERINGAKVTIMQGLGHFPMSENPDAFLGHLRPVLAEIRANTGL
jgi:pimeloyl-ACP methyl ester carboxylesterase